MLSKKEANTIQNIADEIKHGNENAGMKRLYRLLDDIFARSEDDHAMAAHYFDAYMAQ